MNSTTQTVIVTLLQTQGQDGALVEHRAGRRALAQTGLSRVVAVRWLGASPAERPGERYVELEVRAAP